MFHGETKTSFRCDYELRLGRLGSNSAGSNTHHISGSTSWNREFLMIRRRDPEKSSGVFCPGSYDGDSGTAS